MDMEPIAMLSMIVWVGRSPRLPTVAASLKHAEMPDVVTGSVFVISSTLSSVVCKRHSDSFWRQLAWRATVCYKEGSKTMALYDNCEARLFTYSR